MNLHRVVTSSRRSGVPLRKLRLGIAHSPSASRPAHLANASEHVALVPAPNWDFANEIRFAGRYFGEMPGIRVTRSKRGEPYLPPGPARDLVDLFKRLRHSHDLRIGQIASRTGYTPSHISEVLSGWKAPSPDAAAKIAQVLGGDAATVARARDHAENLADHKRELAREAPRTSTRGGGGPASAARFPVQYRLANPDVTISIFPGDLLDQDTHIAIGFSDTFDTSITDDRIIHSSSIQGQLLRRLFDGDQRRLDDELATALAPVTPVRVESGSDKPFGKLVRYPLGTVATIGEPRRLIFAVAYGLMGNDLVARAPVSELWHCYSQLWEAMYRHGQRAPLSVPVMGSGLARVDSLDHDNIVRLILLSFVGFSRVRLLCRELRIVISDTEIDKVSPTDLMTFLRTL